MTCSHQGCQSFPLAWHPLVVTVEQTYTSAQSPCSSNGSVLPFLVPASCSGSGSAPQACSSKFSGRTATRRKLRAPGADDRKPSAVKVYAKGAFVHHSHSIVLGFASRTESRFECRSSTALRPRQHKYVPGIDMQQPKVLHP